MSQLLTAMEFWTGEIQKGNPVDVIHVDSKKAFDQVPHERLLLIWYCRKSAKMRTIIPLVLETASVSKWYLV